MEIEMKMVRRLNFARFRWAVGALALMLVTGMSAHNAFAASPPVATAHGEIRGTIQNGVNRFLGIPYAAPPVGELRWMPPQPPRSYGSLEAKNYGSACPQVTTLGPFAGPTSANEDCLFLNVFTTDVKASHPVIVWVHGGGNISGSSSDYDGERLAKGGSGGTPVVVVTLNYRLGVFGFLSQSDLNSEGHLWGNYGILDIQAGLRWVRENIAQFGGDPKSITLAGQSAGAVNVAANLLSPGAENMFHRAITQSLPISNGFILSADAALKQGEAFAVAANCNNAECLRALSASRVLQLQGTPNANGPYVSGPSLDGVIIPILPEMAWTSGAYHQMPIMGGMTKDELTFSLARTLYYSGPPQSPLSPERFIASNKPDVLANYPLSKYSENPTLAQARVISDPFVCDARRVLHQQAASNPFDVFAYVFSYDEAPFYFPRMLNRYDPTGNFRAMAYHTGDIQFLFENYHGGHLGVNLDQKTGQPRNLNYSEKMLANRMIAAWTNFAKSGNPNGSGVPRWPPFKAGVGPFWVQDIKSELMTDEEFNVEHKCDFWAGR